MVGEEAPPAISVQRRGAGAVLAFVGWMLSPLSWWNDAFVNWPLAYGAANLVALMSKSWFEPALYVAYFATNVLGFVMMHAGIAMNVATKTPITRKSVLTQLLVTLAYTGVMVALVRFGLVKPLV